MSQKICLNCKYWKETKPEVRIGKCHYFNVLSEWCAGVVYQTPKRIKICEGFEMKILDKARMFC